MIARWRISPQGPFRGTVETDPYYADVVGQDLETVEQDWSSVQEDLELLRGADGIGEVERLLRLLPSSVSGLEDALVEFELVTGPMV